jgi:hypothetical protein
MRRLSKILVVAAIFSLGAEGPVMADHAVPDESGCQARYMQSQTGVREDNDPGPADRSVPNTASDYPPGTLAKEVVVPSATCGDRPY